MRRLVCVSILIFVTVFSALLSGQDKSFPVLRGPYLGQIPPGKTAKPFAPEILNRYGSLGCSGFLHDGTVFVFSAMIPGTDWRFARKYQMKMKNGVWTAPEIVPFIDFMPYNFTTGPAGQTIWFTTKKSPDKSTYQLVPSSNIWAVTLHPNGWSEPVMMGPTLNTDEYFENYPTVTTKGNIYFMSRRPDSVGRTDIYMAPNLDGRYGPAVNLGSPINTTESDQDPYVAPDESYLIYCMTYDEGFGRYDLVISFRNEDGTWSVPVNMGPEINSEGSEFRPCVTPDGRYLFFTSYRNNKNNIYWIDASIIDDLKYDYKR